jgi:hypothetical protein
MEKWVRSISARRRQQEFVRRRPRDIIAVVRRNSMFLRKNSLFRCVGNFDASHSLADWARKSQQVLSGPGPKQQTPTERDDATRRQADHDHRASLCGAQCIWRDVEGLGLGVGRGPDLGLRLVELALSVGDGILPHPTDWPDLDALSIPCGLGIIKGTL